MAEAEREAARLAEAQAVKERDRAEANENAAIISALTSDAQNSMNQGRDISALSLSSDAMKRMLQLGDGFDLKPQQVRMGGLDMFAPHMFGYVCSCQRQEHSRPLRLAQVFPYARGSRLVLIYPPYKCSTSHPADAP